MWTEPGQPINGQSTPVIPTTVLWRRSALGLARRARRPARCAGRLPTCDRLRSHRRAPASAMNLGALLSRHGDVDGARAANQWAIDSGHPDYGPAAAVNLGLQLNEWGDADGARAAWQWAIDSGHPKEAGKAAVKLGLLLHLQGDADGAQAAWQRAIDFGHAEEVSATLESQKKLDNPGWH